MVFPLDKDGKEQPIYRGRRGRPRRQNQRTVRRQPNQSTERVAALVTPVETMSLAETTTTLGLQLNRLPKRLIHL